MPNENDLDARIQFLVQSSESLHASLQELHTQVTEREKKVDARFDKLLTTAESLLAIASRHQDRLDKLDGGDKP